MKIENWKLLNLLQKKRTLIISGIILIILILLFIILEIISPVFCQGEEKLVNIEKGWGAKQIAEKLKQENLIKTKWLFVYYVWLRRYNDKLQAGQYLLSPNMTVFRIAERIAKGQIVPNWIKATIPEGWDIKKIQERLIALEIIAPNEKLPKDQEGYLFPDTYYFYKDAGVEAVVEKMKDNFNRRLKNNLPSEAQYLLSEGGGKTLYDILIMASILEKEVISDEDRAIVSGIFWDRLKINYPLESCATIAYILGKDKWRYSIEETKIKSPYNTYLNIGLPPTPINNPGLSAIKAAIYPIYTDYNFFLTDPETGNTIFSKTLQEHNQNKVKYFE